MRKQLDYILDPKSVAIIGASNKVGKWGYELLENIVSAGFRGRVFPINPREREVQGLKAFQSILDVPEPIDLAVVGIPAPAVPAALRDCATKGIRGLVVVAAGFGETGDHGKTLESEIAEIVRQSGMRMVGPNCVGVISSSAALNATPLPYTSGSLGFITQSGNLTNDVEFIARKRGLGFSKLISCGNQTDIQFHEYIDYLRDDPDTRVIMLYLEEVRDGHSFMRAVSETVPIKPVVAIKAGQTETGVRAATSHTGALAGSYQVYEAAFKQVGITRASDSNDLIDIAEAFVKLPAISGNRVVILTDGGGHGAMACDAADKAGLEVRPLPQPTRTRLREVLLPQSIALNPVDFAGAAEADLWNFIRASEIILQDQEVDGLLIVGALFGGYAAMFGLESLEVDVAKGISELVGNYNKPIIMHCPYPAEEVAALQALRAGGVPVYPRVETAAKCMAALADYGRHLDRVQAVGTPPPAGEVNRKARDIVDRARDAGRSVLLETEAMGILSEYGVPVPTFKVARTAEEAVAAACEVGYPVVAKVLSADIVHKSDAGAVRLGLRSDEDVKTAFKEIMDGAKAYSRNARIDGVVVSPMQTAAVEVVVGLNRDIQFGPVVMFGLGGVFVEVLKDVAFRVAPLTQQDAYEMVQEIKGYPILEGVRGGPSSDVAAIVDIIQKVSSLALEIPEIKELDLNPVFVHETGARAVDARIILS